MSVSFTEVSVHSFSSEFSWEVRGGAGFCEARMCLCLLQYRVPMAKHSVCIERLLKAQLLNEWMSEYVPGPQRWPGSASACYSCSTGAHIFMYNASNSPPRWLLSVSSYRGRSWSSESGSNSPNITQLSDRAGISTQVYLPPKPINFFTPRALNDNIWLTFARNQGNEWMSQPVPL